MTAIDLSGNWRPFELDKSGNWNVINPLLLLDPQWLTQLLTSPSDLELYQSVKKQREQFKSPSKDEL